MGRLNVGEVFPEFKVTNVDGRELSLPTDLEGDYAIVLFYRAWW
jgi:peroxiredoxin